METALPLHDYQRQVLHDLLVAVLPSRTSGRGGRAVAHMPTGAGKTRVACHAAATILNQWPAEGKVVVWLASSEELCEQAADSLLEAWRSIGNRNVALHRFWGSDTVSLENLAEGFLVAGLSKLWAATSRQQGLLAPLSPNIAGVFFDEAHQAIAPTYSFVTEQLVAHKPPLIGLTATPGRTYAVGDQDERLVAMFEQKIAVDPRGHENALVYLIRNQYLAEPNFHTVIVNSHADLSEPSDTSEYRPSDLRALGRDDVWRDAVVEVASDAMRRHQRVIVFCPSVPCAISAAENLMSDSLHAEVIVADTPREDRADIIERFRSDSPKPMVLFNFGVLTAGFDAPKTSCVIVARPTNSLVLYSQMVGRAMRGPRSGGNRESAIYSLIDPTQRAFTSVINEFEHWEELWRTQ